MPRVGVATTARATTTAREVVPERNARARRRGRNVARAKRRARARERGDEDADDDGASVASGRAATTPRASPFGALAALREALPEAKTAPATAREDDDDDDDDDDDAVTTKATKGKLPVRVRATKSGRRGKTVTIVDGVLRAEARAICAEFKQSLGVGGTVEDVDGGDGGPTLAMVTIQGEHVDFCVRDLVGRGYARAKKA